ncbi:uncharacterized protein F21D5.5 isoform X2 [Zerene cesonia]|uniref:uncharacterized protein F21D5.5 isoform X2 n=1 Tax=Zerene cesonia TaxID=33412 RepID=UPI0018E570B1|nr:uncharacterized protein F21D5.5 isoform X2 [Zerene cesonia]
MNMIRNCFLRCVLDSHAPISLPHKLETVVGRSKITKIKDQACSRQQLSLTADCDQCLVEVKQIGINPSGLDGFALKKDGVYKIKHGSKLEILLNQYIHVIEFDPPPDDYEKPKLGIKRKSSETPDHKRKLIKTEIDMDVKECTESYWEDIDKGEVYIYTAKGVKSSRKIAAFDMDGTLIKTKSGKVHPVDTNDWQIIFPCVPHKLAEKHKDGYKIVLLSNQSPIGSGRVKIEDFKKKIEGVVAKLDVPAQVYIATGKGFFRKPATGMWDVLAEQKNDSVPIDMQASFYCGDAAGRNANWAPGKKKDHSMADILLAENLGLKFFTPEQFFLGHSISNVPMSRPEFIPKDVKSEPFNEQLISSEQELLVMVGYPGSGKSFVAKQIEKKSNNKYVTVCRDVLGSWQKCSAEAAKYLQQGKSVIVDSTNPDLESRSRWTSLAKEKRVQCRCAKMTTSKAHALHNNKFREILKTKHLPVNDIVFNTFKSKFVEPTVSEGFKEVIDVKFNPTFEDAAAEKLYKMFLLEK